MIVVEQEAMNVYIIPFLLPVPLFTNFKEPAEQYRKTQFHAKAPSLTTLHLNYATINATTREVMTMIHNQ